MTDPAQSFSAAEAAFLYPRLGRLNEALFELIGAAAGSSATPSTLAALARHLGEHAQRWGSLVPESILLAELVVDTTPDDAAAGLVDEVSIAGTDIDEVVTGRVLPYLDDLYRELERRLPEHAEGAAVRLVRSARLDLARCQSPERG